MRAVALLSVLVVLSVAFSGCSGKKSEPTPSQSPSQTPTSSATSSAPTTTSSAPTTPKEVFNNTATPFRYQTAGNSPSQATMTLGDAGKSLDVKIVVKAHDANTITTLQGEPNSKANVTFKPPSGTTAKQDLDTVTAATYQDAGHVIQTVTLTIANPVAGAWTIKIGGTGNNVDVVVTVVEKFV